ncbi:hypothetical protein CI238_03548, partial [Colletotrichum incanum]
LVLREGYILVLLVHVSCDFYNVYTCGILYDLRRDGPDGSLDKLHHTVNDAVPRCLGRDLATGQPVEPQQSRHALVLHLADCLSPRAPAVVKDNLERALLVAAQQQLLLLLHLAPVEQPLELLHRLAKRLVAVRLLVGRRPRRDGPHEAVAQVREVGVADWHDAERAAAADLLQERRPRLLALGRVQQLRLQAVALRGHESRRDRVDLLGEVVLQLGDVGSGDVVAHHVHLDAQEADGADAEADEGVLDAVGVHDGGGDGGGRVAVGLTEGEVDGPGEAGHRLVARGHELPALLVMDDDLALAAGLGREGLGRHRRVELEAGAVVVAARAAAVAVFDGLALLLGGERLAQLVGRVYKGDDAREGAGGEEVGAVAVVAGAGLAELVDVEPFDGPRWRGALAREDGAPRGSDGGLLHTPGQSPESAWTEHWELREGGVEFACRGGGYGGAGGAGGAGAGGDLRVEEDGRGVG